MSQVAQAVNTAIKSEPIHLEKDAANDAVFLDYQSAVVEDDSPVIIYEKSRRVGISWAIAAKAVLAASASENSMDVFYLSYNKEMTQQFIKDCAFWLKVFKIAASEAEEIIVRDEDKDVITYKITLANDRVIMALPSKASSLRSKQGMVIVDEAAFVDDLQEILKAAFAMLIWGGSVIIISTHNGATNYFNELIQDCRADKLKYSVHRTEFKEAIEQGLYKKICQVKGIEWTQELEDEWVDSTYDFYGSGATEELDVIPSEGSGRYLSLAIIEQCQDASIPILRYNCNDTFALQPDHIREAETLQWCEENLKPILDKCNPNHNHYAGSDFARDGDLSATWILARSELMTLYTPFILEMRNVPFRDQEQVHKYIYDRLPRFSGVKNDARGNGQYNAERMWQHYGEGRAEAVMLSPTWYRENSPRCKAALEDKTVTIPKHSDIADDLLSIVQVDGIAKVPNNARSKGADGLYRHGDTAIAYILAITAAAEYVYIPMEYRGADERVSNQLNDYIGFGGTDLRGF